MDMTDKITFRAELEFQGPAAQLAEVVKAINKLPVRVVVDRIPIPFPFPGGWPIPLFRLLPKEMVTRISKEGAAIPKDILDGINGGIRDAHLHIKDQVFMIGREEFAEVVGIAAENIAREVAADAPYQQAVGALRDLNDYAGGY